jgi:hypothetical protein
MWTATSMSCTQNRNLLDRARCCGSHDMTKHVPVALDTIWRRAGLELQPALVAHIAPAQGADIIRQAALAHPFPSKQHFIKRVRKLKLQDGCEVLELIVFLLACDATPDAAGTGTDSQSTELTQAHLEHLLDSQVWHCALADRISCARAWGAGLLLNLCIPGHSIDTDEASNSPSLPVRGCT